MRGGVLIELFTAYKIMRRCKLDTKGQTCFICMEGVERRHAPNEGLVRGCACRGTAGVAHLS